MSCLNPSIATLSLFAALAAAAPTALAQTTQHSLTLGELDSFGCVSPATNPPTLGNGVHATATYDFAYDAVTHELTLTVTNTSPVDPIAPNPVLTRIAFNMPADAVQQVVLLSQAAAAGAAPRFALAASAPTKLACFGDFDVDLSVQGIHGSIGNALAPILAVPPGSAALGPVVFRLRLLGPGVDYLSAQAIAVGFSRNAPAHQVNAAAKFQAAGFGDDDGGYLSSTEQGEGCRPSLWITTLPRIGTTTTICLSVLSHCPGALLMSLLPGPSQVGPILFPIGVPLLYSVDFAALPRAGLVCFPCQIPNDPNLVGLTVHMTVATPGSGTTLLDLIAFSPRVSVPLLQ